MQQLAARENSPRERLRAKAQSSGLSPSDARRLNDLIDATLLRRPNHGKDDAQLVAYHDDLEELVRECGLERVSAAMRAAWTRIAFLPEPAEIRELLPPVREYESVSPHDPDCRECRGTGWKYAELVPGEKTRRVTRCTCRPNSVRKAAAAETTVHTARGAA